MGEGPGAKLSSSYRHPHMFLLPDVQTHNCCALYAIPWLLKGKEKHVNCSPGAGTSPCLRLCRLHCPALLLQGGKNREKEENVGGDGWKFRESLS